MAYKGYKLGFSLKVEKVFYEINFQQCPPQMSLTRATFQWFGLLKGIELAHAHQHEVLYE